MTASQFLNDAQKERIRSAIAEAEKRTSAEIVPAIAASSGRYDRAEDLIGLWCGMLALIAVWTGLHWNRNAAAQWEALHPLTELVALTAAVAGGFLLGAIAATKIHPLRRWFVSSREMDENVSRAAATLFHDSRIHHADSAAGILVYVSLFERAAAVLADERALNALGQSTIDALCAELTQKLASGDPAEALSTIAARAADHLTGPLPRAAGDKNEFADALILID